MHAAHAFISVWDDHEVEDNYAGDQPDSAEKDPNLENNNEYPRRVPFGERRKNGYKAFFEAMPRIQMKGAKNQIYGSLRLGGLVELFLTDQRQYRDPQPCDDALLDAVRGRPRTRAGRCSAPSRRSGSRGRRQVGRQVEALGFSEMMVMSLDRRPKYQRVSQDQWDGYAAERPRDPRALPRQGRQEPGRDHRRHPHLLRRRHDDDRERRRHAGGVEFVGGSATSLGIPEYARASRRRP